MVMLRDFLRNLRDVEKGKVGLTNGAVAYAPGLCSRSFSMYCPSHDAYRSGVSVCIFTRGMVECRARGNVTTDFTEKIFYFKHIFPVFQQKERLDPQ